jgi:hypothetical protein
LTVAADNRKSKGRDIDDVVELTAGARQKRQTVVFAGVLVKEDDDSVYIADPQGTWVLSRDDVVSLGDWEHGKCVPPEMQELGRPVRVAIADGSTIHEVRPWQVHREGPSSAQDRITRQILEKVFSLGGGEPGVTERTIFSEQQVLGLERAYARHLGWNPEGCPGGEGPSGPPSWDPIGPVACGTKSWDCDTDGNAGPTPHCCPDSDESFTA